jgi:FkbM family methyltransferase
MILNSKIYDQHIASNEDCIFKNSLLQEKMWDYNVCKLISELIEDNTEFVDIGANIGLVSLGVKKLLENKNIKKYHCFEPNHIIFSMLKYNTSIHEDISLYNFAISDKISLCNMRFSTYNNGCTHIHKLCNDSTDYSYDIQKMFIYNYIDENNIFIPTLPLDFMINIFQNVSVIKIDVEGFEYYVLKGAEIFLKKFKPSIVIEIFNDNFEKCNQLLISYGYILISKIENEDYLYKYNF